LESKLLTVQWLGYGLEYLEFESRQRLEIFLSSIESRSALGYIQTSNSVGIHIPPPLTLIRHVNKSYHTFPSSAKVKLEWSHTSHPSIRLHAVHRDTFTFNYCIYTTYDCVVNVVM